MMLFQFLLIGCGTEPPPSSESEPVVSNVEELQPSEEPILDEPPLNQPPQIVSLDFEKTEYLQGEELRIIYESMDPEGDAIRDEIFWSVNGRELVAEKGKLLRKKNLKRGDQIVATLVVRDASSTEATEAQRSIQTTIANAPPQWVRDPREIKEIEGYTVQAVDPDGDPITYRLTGAPEGMSISQRGRLSYKGSTTEKGGAYTIAIIAEDPEKAAIQWSFSIQLSPGSEAGK